MMKSTEKLNNSLSITEDTTYPAQNTNPSDSPTGFVFIGTTLPPYQILPIPKYVGTYHITVGFSISLEKKPLWLHRYMTRILLGWKWVDIK